MLQVNHFSGVHHFNVVVIGVDVESVVWSFPFYCYSLSVVQLLLSQIIVFIGLYHESFHDAKVPVWFVKVAWYANNHHAYFVFFPSGA